MNTEQFPLARDLFYLNWAFIGAALGCFLRRFRRSAGISCKNRTLAFAAVLLSGAVAAAAGAFIVSGGAVFSGQALYLPALLILVVLAAAFRFPRACGLPLFLLGGVFIVWAAFSLLRYPPASGGELARITNEGARRILVSCETVSGAEDGVTPSPRRVEVAAPEGADIEITYTEVTAASHFPLIGGVSRGLVTGIKSGPASPAGGLTLYTARGPTPSPLLGTVSRELKSVTPSQILNPGQSVSVYKEGGALVSR
jgi:hypothetical protein